MPDMDRVRQLERELGELRRAGQILALIGASVALLILTYMAMRFGQWHPAAVSLSAP